MSRFATLKLKVPLLTLEGFDVDPNMMKLFQISQLAIEYLLFQHVVAANTETREWG